MKSQAEKEYLAKFAEMPVEERWQHYFFALKFLADLLAAKDWEEFLAEDTVAHDTVGDELVRGTIVPK